MDDYILTLHTLVADVTETDGEAITDEELVMLTPTDAHELAGLLRDRAARLGFLRRYIAACPADRVLTTLHPVDAHALPAFADCLLRRATEDPGIVALLVSALVHGTLAPTLTQWMLVSPSVASVIVDTAALTTTTTKTTAPAPTPAQTQEIGARAWVIDVLAIHGESLQLPHAYRLLAPAFPHSQFGYRRVTCSGNGAEDLADAVRAAAPGVTWTLYPQYDLARPWPTSLIGRTTAAFTVYAPPGCFLYVDRIHVYGSANKTDWCAEAVYETPPAPEASSVADNATAATAAAAASSINLSTAGPSPSSDSGYASDVSLQESYTVLDLLRQNRRNYEQEILIESRVQHYAQRNTQVVLHLDPAHMHTGIRIVCEYEYVSRIELYGEAILLC